jgi:imidazole glycerol-phosphate synthase subunit HisH
MVAILDYGIGNITSILNMLRKIGAQAVVTADKEVIERSEKIILPGVGHFDYCMQQLRKADFYETLLQAKENGKPILGVCVGCQMLMESSEEGKEPGLGWISGSVVRFRPNDMKQAALKIPHMAWTDVKPQGNIPLYEGIAEPRFYFVHSYHLECSGDFVTAKAEYGYTFVASVAKGNIMGVQFHPEKSHRFGMQLYDNFIKRY